MYFILLLVCFYAMSCTIDLSQLGVSDTSPWWTLLTYSMVHLSFIHLLINSIAFMSYWRILKRYFNTYAVLCIAVFTSVISAYLGKAAIPTVGASAVIYSMAGTYIAAVPSLPKGKVKFFLMVIISFIFTGLFAQSINTDIHIYSFFISAAVSLLTRRFIYVKA